MNDNKIIEDNANKILNSLSNETKTKYANAERHTMKVFSIIATIVFIFLCVMFLNMDNNTMKIICCAIIIVFIIFFMVIIINDGKKTDDELALRYLKKKLQAGETFNIEKLKEEKKISSNFSVTKEIPILSSGWSSLKILIDDSNKKFIYQKGKTLSKVYNYSDIISYEVYENGKSVIQGRAGSALIGGAFFGLGGLIVGSSMRRNVDEKCNQLKLFIRLDDLDCPQIVITYIDNVEWNKTGWTYRNMKENLQSVCSILEFMLNNKTMEQSIIVEKEPKNEKTSKEQLQELKEMLDEGLITQEDFDIKKKQILGL